MKNLPTLLFVILSHIPVFTQNLIAHYPFDGNALDNSENNHHGTPFGVVPTEDRFGNPDGAFFFDGTDDYVSVNDHPDLRLSDTDYTISLWVKVEEYTNPVTHALLSKRILASNSGYLISVAGYDHPLNYAEGSFIMINSQNVDPTLQSELTNTLSEWTNLIITYCLDTETITFYVNGEEDISGFLPPLNPNVTADLWIGKDPLNNSNKLLFDGSMDDVMIFNKKLTQKEIDEIANPTFEFSLGPDIKLCEGESFILDVSQWNPDEIIWQDGSMSSTLTISESGVYSVVLTSNGISASDEIHISFESCRNLYIPNTFSPNFDGINDYFNVFSDGDVEIIENMKVFNRWGGLVFEGENLPPNHSNKGWNGILDGKPLNSGIYVYVVSVIYRDGEKETFTGDVNLVR